MIISLIAMIIGAALGAYRAYSKNGNRLDIAQYAAIYGIAFGVLSMFVLIILARVL